MLARLKKQMADAKEDDAKRSSKQREAVASYQQDYQVERLVCMCTSEMLLLPAGSCRRVYVLWPLSVGHLRERAFPAPLAQKLLQLFFLQFGFVLFFRFRVRTHRGWLRLSQDSSES
jgi:hypothetical protein